MDEQLKNENGREEQFSMFVVFWEQSGQAGVVRRYADHIFIQMCFRIYFISFLRQLLLLLSIDGADGRTDRRTDGRTVL